MRIFLLNVVCIHLAMLQRTFAKRIRIEITPCKARLRSVYAPCNAGLHTHPSIPVQFRELSLKYGCNHSFRNSTAPRAPPPQERRPFRTVGIPPWRVAPTRAHQRRTTGEAQCGFACFVAVFLTPFCDGSVGQWRAWCFLVEFRREKRFFRATCKTDKLP